jgi:histidinol-phosphate aminotransferase
MTAITRPARPAAPMPRPGILDVSPYVGGESKAAGVERVIRLASNESALGPSPRAIAAYQARAEEIHRYPDGGSTELRDALARHHGLDAARIVCGSGSDELIALLVRAYVGPGDEVVYSRHGFLMYPIATIAAGATPIAAPEKNLTTDVDALLAAVTDKTRIVFLANPNNPTGTYISAEDVTRLHAGLPPSVLLIIDAAYAEFVSRNDYDPGVALVDSAVVSGAENVVMLRTFSKIYALGGMRLGWAYCSPLVADVLNRVRSPFNVNAAAQAAGIAALADVAAVDRAREHNDIWLPWFTRELTGLGLTVNPSVGNFVLVRFPEAASRTDAFTHGADAAFAHLQSRGILTRKMGAYHLPEWLRITIGTEEEMRQVVAVLREFLAT